MVTELSAFSWKGHSSNLVEVCLGRRIRHHNASNLSLWKYLKIDSTLEEAFTEDLDKSRTCVHDILAMMNFTNCRT